MTAQTIQTGNGTQPRFDIHATKEPLKLLANQTEKWLNFGNGGKSFHEAAEIILAADKDDGDREDLGISRLSAWAFGPTPDGTAALATIPMPGRDNKLVPLRAHAFNQLCQRVGAPSSYVSKLPAKLQMACVNHGIQHESSENGNLVRLANGQGRALVSDRFAALDNYVVLEVLESTFKAAGLLGDVRVRSVAVGPTCSLRMTFPEHDALVKNSPKVNDIIEVGLDVLNGELGNRSISLTPLTWRLVCLNGMRRADREVAQRLSHIGNPERLNEAFRDAVPVAIAASQGMAERMGKAVDTLIDDVLGEFDALRAFGLTATESRDVARDVMTERKVALPEKTSEWAEALADVRDISAYEVLNGVTHVAQSHGTDRRIEMEESAAKYLYARTRAA